MAVIGVADDDVVLEMVVVLGTVATDPGGADLLLKEALVDALITLLSGKICETRGCLTY